MDLKFIKFLIWFQGGVLPTVVEKVFDRISLKIFSYALIGGSVALFDLIIFAILVDVFGLNYFWVNFFGFIGGTCLNYFLCILFVFNSEIRFKKPKEIMFIFLVSIVTLVFSQILIFITIDIFDFSAFWGKSITISLLFFWNYFIRSRFIFAEQSKK